MKREIVQAGETVLRQTARPLTPEEITSHEIQQLIRDMHETVRAAPGVGLAAPQIGLGIRLAVIEDREEYHGTWNAQELADRGRKPVPFHVIINPEIEPVGTEFAEFFEGCLSVNGYVAAVRRWIRVRVNCLDENAAPVTIEADGWYARILQHEIDHLNGTIYVDRMNTRTLMTADNYRRLWREHERRALEEFGSRTL